MAEVMRVVAGLTAVEQNELAAFLLHLRLQQEPHWRADVARRIDDRDPSHWTSLEDWRKELALSVLCGRALSQSRSGSQRTTGLT
jgi:hypothetical protein